MPSKSITKVIPCRFYNIFTDDEFKTLQTAGNNWCGQLCLQHKKKSMLLEFITYFDRNNISIQKIGHNMNGEFTMFISDKGELYGCGYCGGDNKYVLIPQFIKEVSNVIDAQSSESCEIALCSSSDNKQIRIIISYWCRIHNLPSDLRELFAKFSRLNKVYSSTDGLGGGRVRKRGFPGTKPIYKGWGEIGLFTTSKINIVKIALGDFRSFFIDDTGVAWVCGSRYLGIKESGRIEEPEEIQYFIENDIKIKDISCGDRHNMALTIDGNVYVWGVNEKKQCGFRSSIEIQEPKRIKFFDDHIVDIIKCGWNHNYVHTADNNGYYLFGDNEKHECLVFDDKQKYVLEPNEITDIVKTKCKCKEIVNVEVGCYTTFISCK